MAGSSKHKSSQVCLMRFVQLIVQPPLIRVTFDRVCPPYSLEIRDVSWSQRSPRKWQNSSKDVEVKSTSENEDLATTISDSTLLLFFGGAIQNHQSLLFQSRIPQVILASGKDICRHAKDIMSTRTGKCDPAWLSCNKLLWEFMKIVVRNPNHARLGSLWCGLHIQETIQYQPALIHWVASLWVLSRCHVEVLWV